MIQIIIWVTFTIMVALLVCGVVRVSVPDGLLKAVTPGMFFFACGALTPFFLFTYCIYVYLALNVAGTSRLLANISTDSDAIDAMEKLRLAPPFVSFVATCYHRESMASAHQRNSHTRRKFVTHTASQEYKFEGWRDCTAPVTGLEQSVMSRLVISKKLLLNKAASERFEREFKAFKNANLRDEEQEFKWKMSIAGHENDEDKMLCVTESSRSELPWWVNSSYYRWASLLLWSVPYRVLLDRHSGVVHHCLTKEIFS